MAEITKPEPEPRHSGSGDGGCDVGRDRQPKGAGEGEGGGKLPSLWMTATATTTTSYYCMRPSPNPSPARIRCAPACSPNFSFSLLICLPQAGLRSGLSRPRMLPPAATTTQVCWLMGRSGVRLLCMFDCGRNINPNIVAEILLLFINVLCLPHVLPLSASPEN